jgi:hypothetical protein
VTTPTPHLEKLRFAASGEDAADPDERVISEEELEKGKAQGKTAHRAA